MEIHVLHVLNSAHGGSAISTFELIEALNKRGIKSSLVCFNNATNSQQQKIKKLVNGRVLFIPLYWMNKKIRSAWWKRPLIELMSLWKTWRGYRFQKIISELVLKNGVTIVHTSTILNPEGAIAARRNKLPHIWHVRELIGASKYFQFYNYRHLSNYIVTHSKMVIANSNVTKGCLEAYMPAEKIIAIPNSIEVERFDIRNHEESRDKLIVGMVGNVTSRLKNHQFFIAVAGSLKDVKDIEFRIYGSLPGEQDAYYAGLRSMVKANDLGDKLVFVDFREDPSQIMREIDILFHPAENESFGRIFIEAMAGGIPVIGINIGGALEMVRHGENGFLINMDVDEGKQSLLRLINDPQLRGRLGMNGRKLVEKEYTLDKMVDRMMQVYH